MAIRGFRTLEDRAEYINKWLSHWTNWEPGNPRRDKGDKYASWYDDRNKPLPCIRIPKKGYGRTNKQFFLYLPKRSQWYFNDGTINSNRYYSLVLVPDAIVPDQVKDRLEGFFCKEAQAFKKLAQNNNK